MKRFIKNNQGFICVNCRKKVEPHPTSSRDHCNHCLFGLHVDINPGDRLNNCKGLLKPTEIEIKSQKTKIVYKCEKCSKIVKCITAPDDNFEQIIKISTHSNK